MDEDYMYCVEATALYRLPGGELDRIARHRQYWPGVEWESFSEPMKAAMVERTKSDLGSVLIKEIGASVVVKKAHLVEEPEAANEQSRPLG